MGSDDPWIIKPGSPEAIANGCECPIADNHYGAGVPGKDGDTLHWYNEHCPLHRVIFEEE